MFNLKIIQHAEISSDDLDKIISIKSFAWPYPYEKQLDWIKKNLKDSDLHVILSESANVAGYLNLINIEIKINHIKVQARGVGNVCVKEKSKGLGQELMKQTNKFLMKNDKIGLLFCKPQLINFYFKTGWILLDRNRVIINMNNQQVQTMLFNYSFLVNQLEYTGTLF